jgi:hypothetical protein
MATPLQRLWTAGLLNPAYDSVPLPPAQPTEFEQLTKRLGLHSAPHLWPHHRALRAWVHKHKNKRYVPESLLAALDERVVIEG